MLAFLLVIIVILETISAFSLGMIHTGKVRNLLRKTSLNMMDKPLTELCNISKEACDAVTPMLAAFYSKIRYGAGDSDTAKLKSDATFFSIADGIVQHMFIEYLFAGNKFGEIVGEEDGTAVNILEKPYSVDDLIVPAEFDNMIETTLEKVKALAARIDPKAYSDITVFVDPIDGTREFATGKGDKVTILVGYNDPNGRPAAGIMYRPLTEPPTWAAGAAKEECIMGELDMAKGDEIKPKGLLITDGKVSPFIANVITELGWEQIPSLASGNRAMMLLEGKAGAYIRDTGGFAKWDTSGPQAVIEAYGGTMSKLPPFLEDESLESYTHLKAIDNLDFCDNSIVLTLSNSRAKEFAKERTNHIVRDAAMVKEYACLRGLVALDKNNMEQLPVIRQAMLKVMKSHPPLFT